MSRTAVKKKWEPDFEFPTEFGLFSDVKRQRRTDGMLFENEEIRNTESDREFHQCIFRDCTFTGEFEESLFLDVIFDHCDLSNCIFSKNAFQRVWLKNCRFVGTDFTESGMKEVMISGGMGDYSNFSACKWKKAIWKNTRFAEAGFSMMELKEVEVHECDFTKCEFLHTKLKGLDFSDSVFPGAAFSQEDIRGLTVNTSQAVDCAILLGLIVKW